MKKYFAILLIFSSACIFANTLSNSDETKDRIEHFSQNDDEEERSIPYCFGEDDEDPTNKYIELRLASNRLVLQESEDDEKKQA
ncbi:MAG: hypothetical protein R3E91_02890 [Chlamydiales bacterium]